MHFKCLSGGTNTKTNLANETRSGGVPSLDMILHDWVVLRDILALGAAVHAPVHVPVHQGQDLRVQITVPRHDY